jgi:exosortase family protein XrtG
VLKKAGLRFWRYLLGACGLFLIFMIIIRPWAVLPLARLVAAIAGIFGKVTGFYQAYFRYGVIFIESFNGAITVNIDMECSGIIEIAAFVSLLTFYQIYNVPERIYVGIIGTLYTILSNALRISVICTMIHFLGTDYYYLAHTVVGRIVFYVLQVVLYFFVFTKTHVLKMKTGDFGYNKKEEISANKEGDAS